MNRPKILSGDELVARGITKVDGSLPEVGLKDVIPTGSWLEQKQVQSALEARKHLIQVERIEKSGSLSQAEWCAELMLAEVTQKVGGNWQYLGHNVGKRLYLQPEEALFLMESNALQLTYNDVTVSLQQAYALLLRSNVSRLQYKVYASLSRVGYKVFRYEHNDETCKAENSMYVETLHRDETEKNMMDIETLGKDETEKSRLENEMVQQNTKVDNITTEEAEQGNSSEMKRDEKTVEHEKKTDLEKDMDRRLVKIAGEAEDCSIDTLHDVDLNKPESANQSVSPEVNTEHTTSNVKEVAEITVCNASEEKENKNSNERIQIEECDKIVEPNESNTNEVSQSTDQENPMEVDSVIVDSTSETGDDYAMDIENNGQNISMALYQNKLEKLESRQLRIRPCNAEETEKNFQAIPDMCHNQIVTVKIPSEEHIPKNVFLNNTTYVLNVESIRSKKTEADTSTSENDNTSENNTPYRRRINLTRPDFLRPNFPNFQQFSFRSFGAHFRSFQMPFMRPQANMNFVQWNLLMNLQRFRPFQRPPPLLRFPNVLNNNVSSSTNNTQASRKRARVSSRKYHLNSITILASKLRHIVRAGNTQRENCIALQRLIATYNARYRANLKLNANFEIVNNETILETIELDDDLPKNKAKDVSYDENLNKIKLLAHELKELEAVQKATSKHRRVLSSVIKKFNKSYNADICLRHNEVVDKSLITLDSSDSDCIVEEPPKKLPKIGKKLKNPFSILKRLSEKNSNSSKTSHVLPNGNDDHTNPETKNYSDEFAKLLGNWLPKENDFGRVEIPSQNVAYDCIVDQKRGEYLYEFIKNHTNDYKNWLELKIGLLKAVEAAQIQIESTAAHPIAMDESKLDPIIGPEDYTDMPSILQKLSVIKNCTNVRNETHWKIDFDVYNRDVQNFKKTNKPTPHFRVICVSESALFPSGSDVVTLHSAFKDEVPLVFAAVGVGSVSYLQVNPSDLPMCVPNSDFS